MERRSLLVVIVAIMLLILVCYYCGKTTNRVCFESVCYEVEVANSGMERMRGLMNREFLSGNEGMLFVFEAAGIYPFWMKNTLIPLDILWLNQNGEVVYIKEKAMPCSDSCEEIDPKVEAEYVLEINVGEVQKHNFQLGSKGRVFLK